MAGTSLNMENRIELKRNGTHFALAFNSNVRFEFTIDMHSEADWKTFFGAHIIIHHIP